MFTRSAKFDGNRRRVGTLTTLAALLLATLFGAAGVAHADPSADDWYRLRVCESGNNYAINTGNGYYGAYQFDLGTWRSVGGSGYPNDASPATQDALALKLWQSRGWSPWACARIVGLSGSPGAQAAPPAAPAGFIDSVSTNGATATVAGWAFDPNQSGNSIPIDVYINGQLQRGAANGSRDDVNSAFGIGGQHGYQISLPLRDGLNGFCVFAIGVQQGNDTLLGCRNVTAASAPRGFLDSVSASGSTVTLTGWAYDPSQPTTSTPVYFYVNDQFYGGPADGPRDDVNSVMGIDGQHGFSLSAPLRTGPNVVCVYAIGVDPNTHTLLGCPTVQGGPAPAGFLDSVTATGSTVTLSGWAFDPNQPGESTPVYFYVNGQFYGGPANGSRDDVNSAFGIAGQHGFSLSAPQQPGPNTVCVYAIGVDPNAHTLLGCPTV